jgi:hypothetical protein
MKNAVFCDVASCRYCVNRRFGGTYRLHLQGIRNPRGRNQHEQVAADCRLLTLVPRLWISYTLKMGATRSSETLVNTISAWRHIPEDGILHSHCLENLKSYTILNNDLNKSTIQCNMYKVVLLPLYIFQPIWVIFR